MSTISVCLPCSSRLRWLLFLRAKSAAGFAACGVLVGLAILSFQANVFLFLGTERRNPPWKIFSRHAT